MIGQRPFDGLQNPAAYVPRDETTRCLAELEDWAFDSVSGPAVAVLDGPPGIGKTLMLKILETRARGRLEVVYVSNPTFGPRELCLSVLDALGIPCGDDPPATFEHTVADLRRDGSRVLLLIDDVELLHTSTEGWLRRVALESKRNLLVALAVADPGHCARLLAVFGGDARRVSLSQPMDRRETAAFIFAELARLGVPYSSVVYFDESALDAIHERSGGIPAQVQHESGLLLRMHQEGLDGDSRPRTLSAAIVSVGEGNGVPRVEPPSDEPEAGDRVAKGEDAEPVPSVTEALALLARATRRELSRTAGVLRQKTGELLDEIRLRGARAARDLLRRGQLVRLDLRWLRAISAFAFGLLLAFAFGHWSAGRDATTVGPLTGPEPAASVAAAPPPEKLSASPPVASASVVGPPPPVEQPVRAPRPRSVSPSPAPKPAAPAPVTAPAPKPAVERARPTRPRREPKPVRVAPKASATAASVSAAPTPSTEPLLVDVNARPWAIIWIDGQEVGETPLAEIPLSPGPHRFAAQLPDGRRIEREESIGPENRHLRFE